MSDNMRLALTTSLDDKLVGPLRRALDEIQTNLRNVERELGGVQQASQKAGNAMANMQGPQKAAKEAAELSRHSKEALALAEKLQTAWNRTGAMVKGVAAGAAAYTAFKYVWSAPLQQERSYTRQLADASNVAFADRNVGGRVAGIKELDATVVAAVRAGGGKREDALAALNTMVASGTVSVDQAKATLPTITKYATAGAASSTELAEIVVKALQAGFKQADIPKILDMALAAGQQGGFELKDMSKWLPKMLAAGKMSGLGGMEAYASILGAAQASVTTAGSRDEAGNNLVNLLLKVNSSDTANDAKKLGIDLPGSLAAARAKGVNSLDAFVNLVDQVAGKDPRLVKLRTQAQAAGTSDEKKAALNSQADILQGSAIGKLIQDRQALMALVAMMNQREYMSKIRDSVMGANGQFGSDNFAVISQTADFQVQQKENEQLFAQTRVLADINSAMGKLDEATTNLYRKYPDYAASVQFATLAIQSLAAAAAAGAGMFALFGLAKGGAAVAAAGGAGAVATTVATSALATGAALKAAPLLSMTGALGVGAAGLAGYGVGTGIYKLGLEGNAGGDAVGKLAANVMAMFGNGDAKEALESMQRFDAARTAEQQAAMAKLEQIASRPVQVYLDGQQIADQVNYYTTLNMRRN